MTQPLQGLRLVVSGFELEQQEHRGIAVFTKGLLRALKAAGAEIWLLTEFQPSTQDIEIARVPKTVETRITISRILEKLNSGDEIEDEPSQIIQLLNHLPLIKKFSGLVRILKKESRKFKSSLFPRRLVSRSKLKIISKKELSNSPYQRCERLSYIRDIDGLICAHNCYLDSFSLAKRKKSKPLLIDLRGFDGLITTSPLNIKPLNTDLFAQTIHDLIPLDYQRTKDHLPGFTRRLQTAGQARKIFVSNDAKLNYEHSFVGEKNTFSPSECVVTQSPSLEFPGDSLDWEARIRQIQILSNDQKQYSLAPCSYFLFNSSVVPHKNLLFALKAFLESGLEHKNITLCITGKLQKDDYSRLVGDVAANHKSVIFTGYVDEATKRKLYLNALALISPSLVEGFGIPVLDAACLGLSTIASPLGSHREIQAMNDFEDHVLLCSTLISSDWASAMRLITLKHEQVFAALSPQDQINEINKIRAQRINRYRQYQMLIDQAFQRTVCNLLMSGGTTDEQSNHSPHLTKLSN